MTADGNPKPVFGEATREAMAKRGCELSPEEAQEFARSLIRLLQVGVFVPDEQKSYEMRGE